MGDVAGEIGKSVPQRARQDCAGVSHGIVGGDCVRAGHMPPGAGCKSTAHSACQTGGCVAVEKPDGCRMNLFKFQQLLKFVYIGVLGWGYPWMFVDSHLIAMGWLFFCATQAATGSEACMKPVVSWWLPSSKTSVRSGQRRAASFMCACGRSKVRAWARAPTE